MGKKRTIGAIIILLSLPLYVLTVMSFVLVTVGGWTSDCPEGLTISQNLWIRLISFLFLVFNVLLTYSGVAIFRNRINKFTYFALIFGALVFFSKIEVLADLPRVLLWLVRFNVKTYVPGSGRITYALLPKVKITDPGNASIVSGVVNIIVSSDNEKGLQWCELKIDDKSQEKDWSLPFSFSWDSRYWENGPHKIEVTGFTKDNAFQGNTDRISVTSENENENIMASKISIISPKEEEKVRGTITIVTDCTKDNFESVSYLVGSKLLKVFKRKGDFKVDFDTTEFENGPFRIRISAKNIHTKEVLTDTVNVYIDN